MIIQTTPTFSKNIKKLIKKFPNINTDLKELRDLIIENPKSGTDLGNNIFKIRLGNSSIPTGKSGGFRVITYLVKDFKIYLLTIYSKTTQDNINKDEIQKVIEEIK